MRLLARFWPTCRIVFSKRRSGKRHLHPGRIVRHPSKVNRGGDSLNTRCRNPGAFGIEPKNSPTER